MNLSCTLHDPDPKLNLNHFCRSQEQAPRLPACLQYSSSLDAPPQPVESGQSSGICRWPFHALDARPMLWQQRCRAGQRSLTGEMNSCRADHQHHHHDSRLGPPPLLAAVRRGSSFMAGEEARLFGRYSSGPLVGPRPVTAWPPGRRTSALPWAASMIHPTH